MRYENMKFGEAEMVLKTPIKRKMSWIYHVDKDGDISRGKMGALVSVNPAKYAKPEKVLRTGITREKGYLYRVNENCDIIRQKIL